jgi:hypothetical protein
MPCEPFVSNPWVSPFADEPRKKSLATVEEYTPAIRFIKAGVITAG